MSFYSYGKYYGYLKCCIKQFEEQFKKTKNELNIKVSKSTGFIPCDYHTNKILLGDITLENLIKNRICKSKFPIDDVV